MLYTYCKLAQHNDKVLSLALFSLMYTLTRKIKNKKSRAISKHITYKRMRSRQKH